MIPIGFWGQNVKSQGDSFLEHIILVLSITWNLGNKILVCLVTWNLFSSGTQKMVSLLTMSDIWWIFLRLIIWASIHRALVMVLSKNIFLHKSLQKLFNILNILQNLRPIIRYQHTDLASLKPWLYTTFS